MDFLKGQAGVSVLKVDDPAVAEPEFLYAMAHYPVVAVGVDAEVGALVPAPFETGSGNAV